MHPRNRYCKNPADFGELARFRPSLKPLLVDKCCSVRTSQEEENPPPSCKARPDKTQLPYTLDFSDPVTLRELLYAILERDFGLKLEIPIGVLIPTVPQKLNYIHWLEDLLIPVDVNESVKSLPTVQLIPKGKHVIGIDIGNAGNCSIV